MYVVNYNNEQCLKLKFGIQTACIHLQRLSLDWGPLQLVTWISEFIRQRKMAIHPNSNTMLKLH